MTWIMVDIEADGPIPGDYSMIAIGAVVVEPSLSQTFYGQLKPISDNWEPEALAVSGFTREQTFRFDDPSTVMTRFEQWVKQFERPMFISDNNGFDWMFTCWYLHHFIQRNPFGFSSTNLGSLYKGLLKDTFVSFKGLRRTKHDHHPVNDAKGNAEAMLHMKDHMGLKSSWGSEKPQ